MTPQNPSRSKRRVKLLCLAAAIALIPAAICALWLLRDRRSADERLAEIEAARAVPATQNAAHIYNELLQDPRAMSLLDARPDVLHGSVFRKRLNEPWRSEDCPELAAWIDECTPILDKLAEASQLDACRFPISIDLVAMGTMERMTPVRKWTFLLRFALNNDIAEDRLDAAFTKYHRLVQMGNHLRQQPILIDHMMATALTRLTLKSMARFVATGEPAPRHLQQIESMPLPLADDWQHHRKQIHQIDDLMEQKTKQSLGLWDRVKYPIASYRMKRALTKAYPDGKDSPTESTGKWHRQNIARARGLHILIALRRHRDRTGQWPMGLHEVRASVSEPVWTDPLNGDPFIYHRLEDGFELYSKGPNKIDERGRADASGRDDVPIWIPPSTPDPEMMKQLREIYGDRYPFLEETQ